MSLLTFVRASTGAVDERTNLRRSDASADASESLAGGAVEVPDHGSPQMAEPLQQQLGLIGVALGEVDVIVGHVGTVLRRGMYRY